MKRYIPVAPETFLPGAPERETEAEALALVKSWRKS